MSKDKKMKSKTDLIIEKRPDGRLWTTIDGKDIALQIKPCFPWSYPQRYISLRDDEDDEIALIDDLSILESHSRKLVEQAIVATAFVMEVESIISHTEEFEVRSWDVQTKQGRRKFQTKRDSWPQTLPSGGLLIRDIAGDLFHIPEPNNMCQRSKKLIAPFID